MSLINCKTELKLKWTKHFALDTAGIENKDVNSANIVFDIKGTKLYFPVVAL